jgi:hypothetical protein
MESSCCNRVLWPYQKRLSLECSGKAHFSLELSCPVLLIQSSGDNFSAKEIKGLIYGSWEKLLYLFFAWFVLVTVVLVYYYRIGHILHHNVLKFDVACTS